MEQMITNTRDKMQAALGRGKTRVEQREFCGNVCVKNRTGKIDKVYKRNGYYSPTLRARKLVRSAGVSRLTR